MKASRRCGAAFVWHVEPGPRVLAREVGDERVLLRALHDGYCRLRPQAVHRRTIVWWPGALWLVVDEPLGQEPMSAAASHVYFHPDLGLEATGNAQRRISGANPPLSIASLGSLGYTVVRGQEAPEW